MKRTISLILLLLMLFQLSACARGAKPAPTAEPQITAAPEMNEIAARHKESSLADFAAQLMIDACVSNLRSARRSRAF